MIKHLKRWFQGPPQTSPAVHSASGPEGVALAALRQVIDPELDINIVDLGLIRGVHVAAGAVEVEMTLTTQGCPVGPVLVQAAEEMLRERFDEARVTLQWEPAWHVKDISPEGRAQVDGDGPNLVALAGGL